MNNIKEAYKPSSDVFALCNLRAANSGVRHEESEYVEHGRKILGSFVKRADEVIKQFREGYDGGE
jgi:hypothetical protein